MNRKLQWSAVLALMAVSTAASADNYEYLGHKMLHTRDYPFRYYVDARVPTPAGIAISEVERATNAAFQTWEDVSCAYPDFLYGGRTTTEPRINPSNVGDPFDAFNVSTVWVTSSSDPYYNLALASGDVKSGTVPLTYAGYLYQCDIFINAVKFRWTTLPDTPARDGLTDLQTALTHEVGHCMGLADIYTPEAAVMHPIIPTGGNKRVLAPHDSQHVCNYYPEDGAVGSPCSVSDPCTNGLTCIPLTQSDGGVLARYCTKSCPNLSTGECPAPYVCRPSSAVSGATHACLAVPNEAVTQVGKPCTDSPGCGSPRSICQPPTGLPSGGTAWVGGYCQEDCVAGSTANTCPAGSVCTELGTQDRCFKSCRPGTGDCREGYTCSPLAQGDVCVPVCYNNDDCNSPGSNAFICRVCDRVCIQNKTTGKAVGDPCASSAECGLGQECVFINNHPQGVCAQPCNTALCGCPAGSSCRQVGPDRLCIRDCSAGTCPSPLTCNPVGGFYGCAPGCRNSTECPQGWTCAGGTCYDPFAPADAGCTLCNDAGNPPPPPPPPPPVDGGTGPGGNPEGCGCSGAPTSALLLGALALLLLAGGRRSWRRR
jgi:MYXO-CTERM domain-containing protein